MLFAFSTTAQVDADSLVGVRSDEKVALETRIKALKLIDTDENGNSVLVINNLNTVIYRAMLFEIAKKENSKIRVSEELINQVYYFIKSDIINSSASLRQRLAMAEEIDDTLRIGKSCYNLGTGYLKAGDFSNGFPYFKRAEKTFKNLDDKLLQAMSLARMSFLYSQLGDVKTSNECLTKAINIRKELLLIDDDPMNRFIIKGMEQTLRMQGAI